MLDREEFMSRAFDADAIIERLKERLKVKSDKEFAKKIGVSQSTLSSWRSRQSIPLTYIIGLAKALKVSTDWIFFGEPIQIKVEASEMDEAVMRICIIAVLNENMGDKIKQVEMAEKMLVYYSMMRKVVSTIKKVDSMTDEKTMEFIDTLVKKLQEDE